MSDSLTPESCAAATRCAIDRTRAVHDSPRTGIPQKSGHVFPGRAALLLDVIAIAIAVAGCGGSASAGSPASGSGRASVQAAYVPGATFLPAMVAKDAGIFARHNLDVTLTPTQTVSTIPGALGRQFDFGPAVAPVLIKAEGSGIGIVAVAASTVEVSGDASQLIVAANSPVRTVAELRGKRLGTADIGAALHASTLNWLQSVGTNPKSITAIEMPFPTMSDQLKAGRVDAVEAIQPFSEIMLKAGDRSLGAPMLSVARPRALSTLWIAQRAWAQSHQSIVKRWIASLVDAQRLIQSNPVRARAILQKYTQLPAAITRSVQLPIYDAEMNTATLESGIAPWERALRRTGQFSGQVPVNTLVIPGR